MLSDFYCGFEKRAADVIKGMHQLFKAENQIAGSGKKFIRTVTDKAKDVIDDDPYKMFKPKPMKSFHGYSGPGTQK